LFDCDALLFVMGAHLWSPCDACSACPASSFQRSPQKCPIRPVLSISDSARAYSAIYPDAFVRCALAFIWPSQLQLSPSLLFSQASFRSRVLSSGGQQILIASSSTGSLIVRLRCVAFCVGCSSLVSMRCVLFMPCIIVSAITAESPIRPVFPISDSARAYSVIYPDACVPRAVVSYGRLSCSFPPVSSHADCASARLPSGLGFTHRVVSKFSLPAHQQGALSLVCDAFF